MKSTVYLLISLLSISLLTFSCSSDPCETVSCINGACNEGICECNEGFLGATCSELDLLGSYYSSDLVMDDDCPQEYKDYDPQFIDDKRCDNLGCISFFYTFLADGIYNRTYTEFDQDSDGNFTEIFSRTTDGLYSINGIEVTLDTGLDEGVVLIFENKNLTAYYSFFQDCFATRHYSKR